MRQLIIVGGGPAGYTAALYAARAGLAPLVIEGYQPLGALALTTRIENYPGFDGGVDGRILAEAMRAQAAGFGAEFVTADAEQIDLLPQIKTITTADQTYQSQSVIIATGAGWKKLGVPGEAELFGAGVSTCATCDGAFYQDLDVAVVGGGDSAMEEALFLTRFAKSVMIIHRRDKLRASKIMQDRALNHPKIKFVWNAGITELIGDEALEIIRFEDTLTGEISDQKVDGLFLAIGHIPRTDVVRGQLDLDENGYIKICSPATVTSLPGVFAAGDVADPHYRQAVTAAASGCAAALDAARYLEDASSKIKSPRRLVASQTEQKGGIVVETAH